MNRIAVSLLLAIVVTLVAAPIVTSDAVQHPQRCSWASNVGDFCVTWDSATARYVGTPPGVPGDWLRGTQGGLTDAERGGITGAILLGTWLVAWLVLGAGAGRNGRGAQVGAG